MSRLVFIDSTPDLMFFFGFFMPKMSDEAKNRRSTVLENGMVQLEDKVYVKSVACFDWS